MKLQVNIKGNDNYVFQNASGESISFTLDNLIKKHTADSDARIKQLESSLYDKDELQKLSKRNIELLETELTKLTEDKARLEQQVINLASEFKDKDIRQCGAIYQESFALFLEGKLTEALDRLDDARIELECQALKEQQEKARARFGKAAPWEFPLPIFFSDCASLSHHILN